MQNIGVAFVELNQYADAVTSFEQVMSDSPSLSAGRYLLKYWTLVTTLKEME
jgi:hypothetical protein